MKSLFSICVFCTALVAIQTASAASTSFVSKEQDQKKGLRYIYSFTCSSGAKGTLTVSGQNDNVAKKLAEQKARVVCEEV